MSKTTGVAAIKLADKVFRLKKKLRKSEKRRKLANLKVAGLKLSQASDRIGMQRKRVQLEKLEAFMESYQQLSIYRAVQKQDALLKAEEWFKLHPEDRTKKWFSSHPEDRPTS